MSLFVFVVLGKCVISLEDSSNHRIHGVRALVVLCNLVSVSTDL